jgi:TolB protein
MRKIVVLLVCASVLPFSKHRILLNRIGPSGAELFIANADRSAEWSLLSATAFDYNASFSPDGKFLLFSSSRFGFKDEAPRYDHIPQPYGELFVMNADGFGQQQLTDSGWENASPAWQPER